VPALPRFRYRLVSEPVVQVMTDLTPDEVEVGRRNLIVELKAVEHLGRNNQGHYEIGDRALAEIIAVLEASKPTVVDREALGEAWDDGNAAGLDGYIGPGRGAGDVDPEAVFARERVLNKLTAEPGAIDREAPSLGQITAALASCEPQNQIDEWPERYRIRQAKAVLAALYPKATEGKS